MMKVKIKCPKCEEEFEMEINAKFGKPALPKRPTGISPQ